MTKTLVLCALTFLILPTTVTLAELKNCNGVWTNKECSEDAKHPVPGFQKLGTTPIPTFALKTETSHVGDLSKMKSLYRDLDLENSKARRQFGIELDISRAESACNSPSATLEECRATVEKLEEKLHGRIQEAKLLEQSKKQTELLEKKHHDDPDEDLHIGQLNAITIYDHAIPTRPIYDKESSFSVKSGDTELSITEREREEPFVPVPPEFQNHAHQPAPPPPPPSPKMNEGFKRKHGARGALPSN